jgi:2-keto-3-deoxy-6-phosphogluconate aldolase
MEHDMDTHAIENKHRTLGRILASGFIPNFIPDTLDPAGLADAAGEAGLRAMEISCRRDDTLKVLADLKNRFPAMSFGVSSLVEDGPYYDFLQRRGPRFPSVREAAESGADFLVSLIGFRGETYCHHADRVIIPGVETTEEAKTQMDRGASLVKISAPALRGGPAYLRTMMHCGPIHFGLPLLVTGGIRPDLVDSYVEAGALAAVAGFDLILGGRYRDMQAAPDWTFIRDAMAAYADAFRAARARHMGRVPFDSADPVAIQRESGRFLNA